MKNKNFHQFKNTRKNLSTPAQIKKFLVGKTIKILNMSGGHNYGNIGDTVKIEDSVIISGSAIINGFPGGNNISFASFSVIAQENKKEIEELITEYKKDISDLERHIKQQEIRLLYLKKAKVNIVELKPFRNFMIKMYIEDKKMTAEEKAAAIELLD